MMNDEGANYDPNRATLLRALGPLAAIAIVIGNVIGSGIFVKPGTIAADAGSFPLIISAWVVGGVFCILGGLCFAELACMFPQAGGIYVYLRETYGKPVAFLFGWNEFLFSRPASNGALSVIFIGSFAQAIDWKILAPGRVLGAISVIVILAAINIVGVVWGGRVQTATTFVKAGFVVVIAVIPFVLFPFSSSGFDPTNLSTTVTPPLGSTFATQYGAVLLSVMWAYNGWHGITPVAEEVKNPTRNIPLALFLGIGILTLLYCSANVAYHGVLSMGELADLAVERTDEKRVAHIFMEQLIGPIGAKITSIVLMISTFGVISCDMLISPRITFAMGRDGVFFRQLGMVHANYRSPSVAIAVQAVMASVLIIASSLLVAYVPGFEKTNIFNMLTNFVIFGASIFYSLAVLAVIILRLRSPSLDRPYRTLGYPLTPVLFLVSYGWFLSQVYLAQPFEAKVGLLLISTGLPAYLAFRAWQRAVGRV